MTDHESSPFLKAEDSRLWLGMKPLKLLGANSYGILSEYLGIGKINSHNPAAATKLQDASEAGLRVIRIWLDVANSDYWFGRTYSRFSEEPNHSTYLSALDRLFADAKKNNLLLVPVFAVAFDQWTDTGGGESFWKVGSRTNLLFKAWIQSITTRYVDDPQIAWWEIADEPNYFAKSGKTPANLDTVVSWATDAYRFLKALDPNHLVSGGFNNTSNLEIDEFDRLNNPFDISSIHVYEADLYRLESSKGISDHEQAIQDFVESYSNYSHKMLHKPIVFGEFNSNKITPAPWFVERVLNYISKTADAGLIWSWEEGNPAMTYYVSPSATPTIVETLRKYSGTFKRA